MNASRLSASIPTYPSTVVSPMQSRFLRASQVVEQPRWDFGRLFESVWTNSVDGMRMTDAEGTIVHVNEAYCRLVGIGSDELIGKPFTVVYDQSCLPPNIMETYHGRFLSHGVEALFSHEIKLRDGRVVHLEASNSYVSAGDGTDLLLRIIRNVTARILTEEALRESEAKFRAIFDKASDGIFLLDLETSKFSMCNAMCARMLGHTQEDFPNLNITDIHPAEDLPFIREQIGMFMREEEGIRSDLRFKRKNGDLFFADLTPTLVTIADKRFLLIIFTDITERKQAEEALTQERNLLLGLMDNIPDQIYFKDTDSRYIRINKALAGMFGLADPAQAAGKTAFDFYTKEHAQPAYENEQEIMRTGQPLVGLEEKETWPDGRATWVSTTKMPLRDTNGQIIGTFGISRDITERKAVEEALTRAERKYHELFENAVQGIFQSTVDGKIVMANAALFKMLGYSSLSELAEVDLAQAVYVNPDDRKKLSRTLKEEDLCSNVELQLKTKDGKVITVLEHSHTVKDSSGSVVLFEGIIEDISARKALEARLQEHVAALKASRKSLEALNAQKNKFMSILSHDLRSPLASVLGFCGILLNEGEKLTESEKTEFLTYIKGSAQQQLSLVNRLLDWSGLETGRTKSDTKEVDLHAIVSSTINGVLGLAKQKDILLYSSLKPGVTIRGDESQLTQVFNNLIGNALKFTPPKGVVAVELSEEADDRWAVAVKDTGIGVPQEDLGKLFKVEERYTRRGLGGEVGTGLGLSVVREIVQAHSGSIAVESEVGKGTTFTLTFPRILLADKQSVLIVDDEQGVRVLHARYVKRVLPQVNILYASGGMEAFECAKKYRPQLIMTDYAMSEMDGYELLNLLKHDSATKDIPVFVITASDSTAGREALLLSGAAAVLVKPVSADALGEMIKRTMGLGCEDIRSLDVPLGAGPTLQHA
jgi:two-component system sensor histidine kinase/response regulator